MQTIKRHSVGLMTLALILFLAMLVVNTFTLNLGNQWRDLALREQEIIHYYEKILARYPSL